MKSSIFAAAAAVVFCFAGSSFAADPPAAPAPASDEATEVQKVEEHSAVVEKADPVKDTVKHVGPASAEHNKMKEWLKAPERAKLFTARKECIAAAKKAMPAPPAATAKASDAKGEMKAAPKGKHHRPLALLKKGHFKAFIKCQADFLKGLRDSVTPAEKIELQKRCEVIKEKIQAFKAEKAEKAEAAPVKAGEGKETLAVKAGEGKAKGHRHHAKAGEGKDGKVQPGLHHRHHHASVCQMLFATHKPHAKLHAKPHAKLPAAKIAAPTK